jgi:AAA domain
MEGAAPSARAALALAEGANLTSRTLHSLLDGWKRGFTTPVRNWLLVADEAGMADIRTQRLDVAGERCEEQLIVQQFVIRSQLAGQHTHPSTGVANRTTSPADPRFSTRWRPSLHHNVAIDCTKHLRVEP